MARQAPPLSQEFMKGVWSDNPVLVQLLGMCPTLAVTNSAENGMAMGLATSFVLISSSMFVTLLKQFIPAQVRIGTYMIIIAAFVTIADLVMAAEFPAISKALGPYIPLIVVNCVILGRAEAFASKQSVGRTFLDATGNSIGFVTVLTCLGAVREILGAGSVFGFTVLSPSFFTPWIVMVGPAGAFLTLGVGLGLLNYATKKGAA
jgi:Na+-translocating ferredoxin:NAD+ oxidoreductase subunit E